ncbi:hypothetical protein [Limnoglobus roseus]|uniref:Uncharacterized protein n=1 Tax=Limnoglobus roseus TaxID=2598579 RepID=A0A5C1ALQ4_9BACT|nr:hypothetical protein [Limnoglobus roseus]QEL19083.1 hypothetical protein PX52LOC_06140 [Limnoglobus roseus]
MPSPPTAYPRFFDDASRQSYDEAEHCESYETNPGVCILPSGEPEPTDPEKRKLWKPVVAIKLHEPYRLRRSQHSYDRQNTPPLLPKVADSGRFIALGGSHTFAFSPSLDGQSVRYRGACDITFVEHANLRCVTGFTIGDEPYTVEQQRRMQVSPGVPYNGDESQIIVETSPETRKGQVLGSYINHADPYSGLEAYGGCYSVTSWIPDTCFSQSMISAGGLPVPNPPPPPPPPALPPSPGSPPP